MWLPKRQQKRVFILIGLLGLAYVGITIADVDARIADSIRLGLIIVLSAAAFVSGREYFRITHTGPLYLAALLGLIIFHAIELTEEFAVFQSVPFIGEATLSKRALETVLVIACICLFLVGHYLSISDANVVRRKLESNLRDMQEREQRYRALFEAANDAICIMKDGRFIECNSKTLAMFGCSEDQIIGATPYRFSPPVQPGGQDSKQEAVRRLALAAAGEAQCFEWRHLRYDKTPFDAEISLNRLEFSDGPCVQAIVRDITERRKAEDERARVTAILEATSDLVATATPDGRLTYLNDAGRRMLGWPDDEDVAGHRIMDTHPDWALEIVEQAGIPAAVESGIWSGETAILGPDGEEIPVSQVIMSHRSVEGRIEYLSTIIRDLREQKRAEQALRENEEKYRSLVDSSLMGIGISRGDQIVFANQSLLKIYGHDDFDAFASRSFLDYLTPQSREAVMQWRQRRARGEDVPSVLEHEIVRKDGALRTLQLSISPITLGGREYVQAAFVDITERKRAEEALRASEERFRSVVQGSPMGIHMYRLESGDRLVFTGANPAADEILGVDNAQFVGRTIEEAFPPLVGTEVPERYRRVARDGEPWSTEQIDYEHGRIKGAFEVYAFRTAPGSLAVMFLDVTERRQAEEALRDSTARLRSVFDSSPLAITVTDLDGRITDCSRAALAAYGFASKQEVLGRSVFSFIAEGDRDAAKATMARLQEVGWVHDEEYTLVRSDGTEFSGELSASLMRDPNGKPLGVVGISADITERKNAERDRLRYEDRLRSLASELSLAEERERRRIAAGLHDHACQALILSRMKLEGLVESLPPGRGQEMVGICDSLDGAVESVRELMFDLSSPTLYKFGLEAALEELLEDKLAVEGVQCTFSDDNASKPLGEDVRILLFQSVRELLINIIKHARADEVTLSVERLDETVRITLTDDGVGFDVESVLSASSRSRGFGLFNLRERLAHIGGSLEMNSQPGRGSRFTLAAPLEHSRSGQGAGREGA